MPNKPTALQVSDFTQAVEPLLDAIKDVHRGKDIRMSDVFDQVANPVPDDQPYQYIDLVQEGGGVHGIALAGFTYILEKQKVGFLKMAGTSAGAINTLLLSSVYNKREAALLQLDTSKYYETRSEKILEYLSQKPLSDFVDGPENWRQLLLSLFTGQVNFHAVTKYFAKLKRFLTVLLLGKGLLFIATLLMLIFWAKAAWFICLLKIVAWVSIGTIAICLFLLFLQYRYIQKLVKNFQKLGVNPGKDFEDWIADCMCDNGVHTTQDLKDKLAKEEAVLNYTYKPTTTKQDTSAGVPAGHYGRGALEMATAETPNSALEANISNPDISIESIKEQVQAPAPSFSTYESTGARPLPNKEAIMAAFTRRMQNAIRKHGLHKEIVVVAADLTNGIKVEFPGMHRMYWGDDHSMSPAKYVRASMSIPLFFSPVTIPYNANQKSAIEEEWRTYMNIDKRIPDNEHMAMLVDGGLLSNFPVNVFYNPELPLPSRPTIGVRLEFEDDSIPKSVKNLAGFFGSLVSTMRFFYDREFINKHNMYRKTVRSIDTGRIHWLNFNMTDQEKIELFYRGALAAALFLCQKQNNDATIQHLLSLGDKVNFKNDTFSIYTYKPHFESEDILNSHLAFDWEVYKQQRIEDALQSKTQNIKTQAMMQ